MSGKQPPKSDRERAYNARLMLGEMMGKFDTPENRKRDPVGMDKVRHLARRVRILLMRQQNGTTGVIPWMDSLRDGLMTDECIPCDALSEEVRRRISKDGVMTGSLTEQHDPEEGWISYQWREIKKDRIAMSVSRADSRERAEAMALANLQGTIDDAIRNGEIDPVLPGGDVRESASNVDS